MVREIHFVANTMVGETAFPDFGLASDDAAEVMRVRAFDQLDGALNGHVVLWSQQEMNVFGHDDECVQFVAAFATIPIERLQQETYINFDREQFSAVESRERYEISSRRGDESSRLQKRTSAAESRASFSTLNWHE